MNQGVSANDVLKYLKENSKFPSELFALKVFKAWQSVAEIHEVLSSSFQKQLEDFPPFNYSQQSSIFEE